MALLRFCGIVVAIVMTACTLTLDPDELRADLRGEDATTTSGDGEVSDTTASIDVDTTVTAGDSTTSEDADATLPAIAVAYPGGVSCKLYYAITNPVSGCSRSCPALSAGWDLVFDIANRPDLVDADITWRFSIDTPSDSTLLVPSDARSLQGRRVTTRIAIENYETCTVDGNEPADAELSVEISIDGGGFIEQVPLTLDLQNVTCSTAAGDCPAPPD